MLDIIKNPVFIALVFGSLTYLYMWYVNDKKSKKNPKNKTKKRVNILIPVVITIVVWFLAFCYFDSQTHISETSNTNQTMPINVDNINVHNKYKLINDAAKIESFDSPKSYQLIGKGLTIPNNVSVPDVFIETI